MEKKDRTDWRFKVANREALIGCGLALLNFVWWFGFAYGMGSRPVEEYSYILGMPDWFFYSCVVGFLLITALVIFVVKVFFKEVPFEEEEELR
ncbi:YhdT family protein [Bhargavaea ginsengi]|uniref:YhdT family protein n=1 Tax=Bhargavaea ginsengi TaxID=426757 RepID=UPI002041330C|nr:YhdT family protein [Bhargavaea ginsengi]MCM3088308.1 YhdT family protein [Bhargavaea ginsengi]